MHQTGRNISSIIGSKMYAIAVVGAGLVARDIAMNTTLTMVGTSHDFPFVALDAFRKKVITWFVTTATKISA